MDIKNLKYNNTLYKNQIRLKNELNMVNKELENQQNICEHIPVCVGFEGLFKYRDNSYCYCALCRSSHFDSSTKYRPINACDYKKDKYGQGFWDEERDLRLDEINRLALDIVAENPNISVDELKESLEEIIEKNIEHQKSLKKTTNSL